MNLQLSFACAPYDRVQPLFDGRIKVPGVTLSCRAMLPDATFAAAYTTQEYDVTELSASSHLLAVARGTSPYVGLPVFVSRCFRHSAIYIRTDRGINKPANLRGRIIGVPQYQMTAALCARGLLSDEYGVGAHEVIWRTGGLNRPGQQEQLSLHRTDVEISPIREGGTLSALLAAGELDAVIAPAPPDCFVTGSAGVARLFPDHRQAEEVYFRKTKLFPIMHLIGVKQSIAVRFPHLPRLLMTAFEAALQTAKAQLRYAGAHHVTLPWLQDELARTEAVMGPDFWSYGIERNVVELGALQRWSKEQGLVARAPALHELFDVHCLEQA